MHGPFSCTREEKPMDIISVRESPGYRAAAIRYFQNAWASEDSLMLYDDAITRSIGARNPLPQWYLLLQQDEIIGCVGLISNDFISRGELYPWLCALFIDEQHRRLGLGARLVQHVVQQARTLGFDSLHLCTDLEGYYERFGFTFDGLGYHPWGESSRVYTLTL